MADMDPLDVHQSNFHTLLVAVFAAHIPLLVFTAWYFSTQYLMATILPAGLVALPVTL